LTSRRFCAAASGSWRLYTAPGGAVYVSPEPEPEGAKVWFFTRRGGVSAPPFESLNVSRVTGDDEEAVSENLSRIARAMENRPRAWVKQVAGDRAKRVSKAGFAGEADALITGERDLALVVAVADCVPVVLVGEEEVAIVHSGWRGTLAGISGKAAKQMESSSLRAYVGPCIRGCCYEVSPELARKFAGEFGEGVVSGRMLSLPEVIRRDLEEAEVEVHDLGICTGCTPELFFSHRKQKPSTGRNLAAVARL
jgi:YfiH family protein